MSDSPRPPYVQFEVRAVEDRTASVEAGHFVARDVTFAIVTPAGTKDRIEKEASEWLLGIEEGVKQERIPAEWLHAYRHALKVFQETNETPETGTSIRNWAAVSPAQVRLLLDANIRTVEDLAACTEEAVHRLGMGGRALKEKAKAWLDSSSDTGKVAEELAALRKRNEELEARDKAREKELADLKKTVDSLKDSK